MHPADPEAVASVLRKMDETEALPSDIEQDAELRHLRSTQLQEDWSCPRQRKGTMTPFVICVLLHTSDFNKPHQGRSIILIHVTC